MEAVVTLQEHFLQPAVQAVDLQELTQLAVQLVVFQYPMEVLDM